MSEEKIQLPAFLIAELYSNSLVEVANESQVGKSLNETREVDVKIETPLAPNPSTIKYLGQNKRRVAILLKEESVPFITDSNLEFLTKILKACNFDLRDIAIVNTHGQQLAFEEIKTQLDTEYALLFDVAPSAVQLPFTIPHFQVQQFGGVGFMCAPALSNMVNPSEENQLLKTQLWKALQKMFKLDSK